MRRIACALVLLMLTGIPAASAAAKKPASVKLLRDDLTAVITLDSGKTLKITSKGIKLAPGTYFVKSIGILKKDQKKRTWQLRSIPNRLGGMKTITVAAEQEKILDLGPPLNLHGWCRQGDPPKTDTVNITFTTHGRYGVIYYPGAYRGKKPPPVPVFRLLTPDGTKIHEGRFTVTASNGGCRYVWKPGRFKGKYMIEIKASFGPYKYKLNREGHTFEVE